MMVRKYLATPPSSVYSEQIFSTVGNIYAPKRSCLLPVKVEKLLFLNRNMPLLKYNYDI